MQDPRDRTRDRRGRFKSDDPKRRAPRNDTLVKRKTPREELAKELLDAGATINEAARAIDVHPDTIRRWRKNDFRPRTTKQRAKSWKGRPRLDPQQRYRVFRAIRDHQPGKMRGFLPDMRAKWHSVLRFRTDIWTIDNIQWLIRKRYPDSAEAHCSSERLRLWIVENGFIYDREEGWRERRWRQHLRKKIVGGRAR